MVLIKDTKESAVQFIVSFCEYVLFWFSLYPLAVKHWGIVVTLLGERVTATPKFENALASANNSPVLTYH